MTHPKDIGGMGFRDLHYFNLAMIAKQGWNIMTRPHTLVAKIYKARYFPNSSFFDSKIGHNPNYAWRGIWKARQILMHGCRWSIGNGTSIKVMGDPWLRDKEGAWLPSPQVQGVHNFTINELMIPNMKLWDKVKIESLFPLNIANRIMQTPLLDMVEDDKLIWIDSSQGHYSVKSGYKLLFNISGKIDTMASQDDWRSLWKIHAPPKAKHLLWRICKGCLPTRLRLQERHVSCPLSCPLCDHVNEDDWHVLFGCNVSMQASQAAGVEQKLLPYFQSAGNVREAILNVCARESIETAGIFAMLVWVLWNNRNNKVWNDTNEPGRFLGIKARHLWSEWSAIQQVQRSHIQSEQVQSSTRWQRPPQGWYKCNVDAGFHQAINKTSTSWCLRDHLGRFVAAETTWLGGQYSILEGEAIALHEALKAMHLRNFTKVLFETDAKSVAEAIHHCHGGISEFSLLVGHINDLLLSNPNFSVKFIKRQANMVAHTLARAAVSWPSRCTFETLPLCITSILFNEMI
jgi:hypothetical protein